MTNSMVRRLDEHIKKKLKGDSFANKYNCGEIIYYEVFQYVNEAIAREKQLKKWSRKKKEELITSYNRLWLTLNDNFKLDRK